MNHKDLLSVHKQTVQKSLKCFSLFFTNSLFSLVNTEETTTERIKNESLPGECFKRVEFMITFGCVQTSQIT